MVVYVGPLREEFKLSKDLLCYVSPFFRAAFEGKPTVKLSERLQIPDMKIAALDNLVWILRNEDVTKPTAEDLDLAFNLLSIESDAVLHLVNYGADDILKNETTFDVNSFKNWKFRRRTTDIEAFMISLKKLAVGRLQREHSHDAECCSITH